MWFEIGKSLLRFLHWCTGWFVHPDKGGCCVESAETIVKETVTDLKKEK